MDFSNIFQDHKDLFVICTVVLAFSIVHSLFGIGLLIFGTPTLLLLGYPFEATLFLLLPSAILISLMQIWKGKSHVDIRKDFIFYSAPFVVLGLTPVLLNIVKIDAKLTVAIVMLITSLIRYFGKIRMAFSRILKNYSKAYLIFMGFIHGLSNMGGGLLSVFISSTYNDKNKIRANTAFCYFGLMMIQLGVLFLFHTQPIRIAGFLLPALPLVIFLFAGNKIFNAISEKFYDRLITVFMFLYGAVLIWSSL